MHVTQRIQNLDHALASGRVTLLDRQIASELPFDVTDMSRREVQIPRLRTQIEIPRLHFGKCETKFFRFLFWTTRSNSPRIEKL